MAQHCCCWHSTVVVGTALLLLAQHCCCWHSTVVVGTALLLLAQHCCCWHSTVVVGTALLSFNRGDGTWLRIQGQRWYLAAIGERPWRPGRRTRPGPGAGGPRQ